jgi:hypothetical protein
MADQAQVAPASDDAGRAAESDGLLAGQDVENGVERKVIATANVELVVTDTDRTVDAINTLMEELGGYVANANLYRSYYGSGDLMQGTLTLRVPAERLDEAMAQLEELAVDVPSKTLDRQDVTDQYSDIQAQLRNLEATETELRALLAEVRERPNATPEDILAVHRSLTEVRRQIEQLQGRKNVMDNLIGLSTINVTLTPDAVNLPVVEEGWRPNVVAREATRALTAALQGLGSFTIWVGIFLLPLLRWLNRRSGKRAADAVA